jgi:hypothetical protein
MIEKDQKKNIIITSDECSFGIGVFYTLKRYIDFANRIWTKMTVLHFSHDYSMGAYKCP